MFVQVESLYTELWKRKNNDNSDNQILNIDDNDKSNFVYHNLEDKFRCNQKTAINNEENNIKIESKYYLDLKIEVIFAQLAG